MLSCTAFLRGGGIWDIGAARPGACMPSSVAQVVLYPLVSVWYRGRLNGCNRRKSPCKALRAVLRRGRYNCIDCTKRAVNACVGLYCIRAKEKPCTVSGCKAKEKPRQRGRGEVHLFFSSRSARAAQSSCVSSSVNSYSARSWSASALLHPPSYRAAALLDTSFNMAFLSFRAFALFYSISYRKPFIQDLQKVFLPVWAGAGSLYPVQPR